MGRRSSSRSNCLPGTKLIAGAAALVFTVAMVGGVEAQSGPASYEALVADGGKLAEKLCSNCHATGTRQDAVVPAGVPSMRGIANMPGQTAARLKHFMMNPHPPMPDTRLSFAEVDRLIAFIDSLRSDKAGEPLVPRPKDKPRPVDPS